jgi:uncharacterized protein (DUF885 family)
MKFGARFDKASRVGQMAAAGWLALELSCGGAPPPTFQELVQEYAYTSLSFSPVAATGAGYHVYNGAYLNELLDDYDQGALDRQRSFFRGFEGRLSKIDPAQLSAAERADYDIIRDSLTLQLLELDQFQSYKHNPAMYVELVGNALFTPFVLDYGTPAERYKHIIARLSKVPALFGQARQNLIDAPEIWTDVAMRENDGNHDMIVNTLQPDCPRPAAAEFDRAARQALNAIDDFTRWLDTDLRKKKSNWSLGPEKYAAKFAPALGLGQTPRQVLADAEAELRATREEMLGAAQGLHAKMFPGAAPPTEPGKLIAAVLGKIALKHGTAATYFEDARRDLDGIRQFIQTKGFVTLPAQNNLQVIETPVFMRGIYSVGGFNPAPPLMPHLGAFYWLTPIPATMEPARIESKLREYNSYGLKILTIHEALPGHYLQFEYANRVMPGVRRLLRSTFGNNPYVEGWAVYATKVMIEQGYLDHDPELLLTWHKQYLRAVANAILDIKMQSGEMTDRQAMELMVEQTFQEKEEATAKLQRVKLSSTQLPTYFTGYRAWLRLREKVKQQRGAAFNLAEFHEAALSAGAVPMPALERILLAPAAAGK